MTATETVTTAGRLSTLISTFIEAVDFVLLTLLDALEFSEGDCVDLLEQITEDRSDFVERIRRNYLADEAGIGTAERSVLLEVTSVFERIVWMTHRLARLIGGERARGTVPA